MTHDSLAAALAAFQAELPDVKKTRSADVRTKDGGSYSYRYADLADVSAVAMPLLGKHGLAFTCTPTIENGQFGLRYSLIHSPGTLPATDAWKDDTITGWYPIPSQGSPQTIGGLITYARRYCLCAVTGIAAEEDVDARDPGGPVARQTPQRPAQRRTQTPAAQHPATTVPDGAEVQAAPPVTLPPLPGETDYDTPGTVTRPQLTKIAIQFAEMGFDDKQKTERLAAASRVVGRTLSSSTELSRNEASRLIDRIEKSGTDWGTLESSLENTDDV